MTTRPMLTQREAAAACGVSRSTIRRRREAGELPNAVQDEARGWLIPVDDLLAAGFRLNAPAPPDPPAATPSAAAGASGHGYGQDAPELRAALERAQLEHELELAKVEHARALAEAEARALRAQLADRAEHIEDLQQALKALAPAPERAALSAPPDGASVPGQGQAPDEGQPAPPAAESAGTSRRGRWWRWR